MYNRNIEVREAIEAGERALASLRDARESLGSARNWGLLDLLGGRSISGLVKHVKIDNARQSLSRAKADLNRFSKELSDVRDLQGLNIEIGDFLTFAVSGSIIDKEGRTMLTLSVLILMAMLLAGVISIGIRLAWGATKFFFGLGLFWFCPLLFVLAVLFGGFSHTWLLIVIVGLLFGGGFRRI